MIHSDSIEILDVDGFTWDRIRKFWCRANRWKTVARLKNLNQDLHDLIQKLITSTESDKVKIKRLIVEINASLKGLDNLILTYHEDRSIVSEFEALKENYLEELRILEADTNVIDDTYGDDSD